MDYAPINITFTDDEAPDTANVTCVMPNFGSVTFKFFKGNDCWFLQYDEYPLVKVSCGADLYLGIDTGYAIKILPASGSTDEVTLDNINDFYIGMIEK